MTQRPDNSKEPDRRSHPRLSRDLETLFHDPTPVAIPRRVDDAILNRARAQFARYRRRRIFIRTGGAAAAIAAVVLIGWQLFPPNQSEHHSLKQSADAMPVAIADARDLNGDGQVDILDSLFLAKQVKLGVADAKWDLNHDGKTDAADADVIAMAAVNPHRGAVQ